MDSRVQEWLKYFLGLLQALRNNHQFCHWQTKGDQFYGDHLLFQRLYESLDAEIDAFAEKCIGMSGNFFSSTDLSHLVDAWLHRWETNSDCLVSRCLLAEEDFQDAASGLYDFLKESGAITLGMDDFLMATASAHETNLYLLQQRLSKSSASDLESSWFGYPKQAAGISRSDQSPDYRDYVKRKKTKGEKPLNRKDWEAWMDGKKPSGGSDPGKAQGEAE